MKYFLAILMLGLAGSARAQYNTHYVQYDTVVEVTGTDYVMVEVDSASKKYGSIQRLMVIDTRTGESIWADFPRIFSQLRLVPVRTENLTVVIAQARIFGFRNNPEMLYVLSSDGRKSTRITDEDFIPKEWIVNRRTSCIVVTGYHDDNHNHVQDLGDRAGIVVYDLKALKDISRL